MTTAMARTHVLRSVRVSARPEKFNNYLSYQVQNGEERAAQFADVSATGMRVISRKLTNDAVGSIMQVQFALPGFDKSMTLKAKMIRKMSEFVFAVRFIDMTREQSLELQSAIDRYVEFQRRTLALQPIFQLRDWFRANRAGVWMALAAVLVFSFVATEIYQNSDEHRGAPLASWGKTYPKQWYIDYVSHDTPY